MKKVRARLTYPHVMSTVALFVALGGTAWALGANSVGSKEIKSNAVKKDEIADNAVTSPKVADGSLLNADFKAGELQAGPVGPPGPTASSFASHDPPAVSIGQFDTQVITLTDGTNGGLLSVPFDARLMVSASLSVRRFGTSGEIPRAILCVAKIAPQGGDYTPISKEAGFEVEPQGLAQIPITAAVDVAPGTYNVQAACDAHPDAQAFFLDGDLTVTAISR